MMISSAKRALSALLALLLAVSLAACGAPKGPEITLEAVAAANDMNATPADGKVQTVSLRFANTDLNDSTLAFAADAIYQEVTERSNGTLYRTFGTADGCYYRMEVSPDGSRDFSADWLAMSDEERTQFGGDLTVPEFVVIDPEAERLVSAVQNADGTATVVTESDTFTFDETGEEVDAVAVTTYTLDAKTLRRLSQTVSERVGETEEAVYTVDFALADAEPEGMAEMRERIASLGSVNPRTLTVVYDPGTPEERQYTFRSEDGIQVGVYCSEGYELYTDPGAKHRLISREPVGDATVYALPPLTPEAALARMSLREKVGQMIMPAFRTWEDANGRQNVTALPDEVRAAISRDRFGGVILFAENCGDNAALSRLTAELQEANADTESALAIPLLLAIDQEGGSVARLGHGTRLVGNMSLGATGDPENAAEAAGLIASELASFGINTDFAPVMDVNSNPANPVIGVRSFSDDPETAARFGAAVVERFGGWGVVSSLKHFPGHGDTATDSHTGLPMVEKTLDELRENELIPFKAGIEAGADMIMTAHIQYPAIETQTYTSISTGEQVYVPATLSKTILTDLLRGEMGFTGVVVSDALEMAAIREHFAPRDVWRMAVEAGVDLFLMPVTVTDSETLSQLERMIDTIVAMVESGEISEARIDESVGRILALKERNDLLSPLYPLPQEEWFYANVGSDENHEMEWELMQKAVTLLKNENGAVPIQVEAGERVALFYTGDSRIATAEFARQRLVAEGLIPADAVFETVDVSAEGKDACAAAARAADHVIVVSTLFGIGELDPATESGADSAVIDAVIAAAHESGKPAVLISGHLPYDAARYPQADAILLNYGSAAMRTLPEAGAAYPPNIPAALCAVFAEYEPQGRLPVDLPALDDAYHLTDTVLYPRGSSAK